VISRSQRLCSGINWIREINGKSPNFRSSRTNELRYSKSIADLVMSEFFSNVLFKAATDKIPIAGKTKTFVFGI
jgi:hypothetical protein